MNFGDLSLEILDMFINLTNVKCLTVKSPLIFCLLVGLSWLLYFIIDFWGGYHGFPLSLLFLPATLLPMLFAAILTFIVLLHSIWSLICLRQIAMSFLIIVLTLAFWFTPCLFGRPYLHGFKYRTLKLSSHQELQDIAYKARTILTNQEYLPGPGKGGLYIEDTHASLWEQMPESEILKSRNSSVVIRLLNDNSVELVWGGGLVGHWGIRIANYTLVKNEYDFASIPIEPNIVVFMTE